jgi:uncharacterized lipoprotein YbaY
MQRDHASAAPLVTGQVVISAGTPAFSGATVHVHLEDVSYADAAAEVLAEAVIPGVCHAPGRATTVPFTLHAAPGAAPIEMHNDYAVRVWVDRDGDGRAGAGDLHSDQSYRVLTGGFGRTVTITLGPS